MRRGEVRDLHWNGGNNGDWVENDEGEICPVDDFADKFDQTYFDDTNPDDVGDYANDVDDVDGADRGNFHTQSRQRKGRAVAGMAMAATGVSPRKPQKNSRPNRSAKRELDMSSLAYGDLVDVSPPKYDLRNAPAMSSAYIAHLSSLLGETKRALDELRQSDEYLNDVAEYDRQVDEANENCPVQPRLTWTLRAEAQAWRRIRELRQRIDKIRQLGDKSGNQQ